MSWLNLFKDLPVGRVARDHPLVFYDVGARRGFDRDLWPLAFCTDVVGFEPEPAEFAKLDAQGDGRWASARFLPQAIGPTDGKAVLHVPSDQEGASLLAPNAELGGRFKKPQFFDVDRTINVDTMTLASALEATGFTCIDYLKIDIEGAELSVFTGAQDVLRETLAIKTEGCFIPARSGQGLVREIDAFLGAQGFQLIDLTDAARWRREGHIIHPFSDRVSPPYARGQLIHGNFLYFRDPETLDGRPDRLIRAALLAMALGYFDHASMILERPDVEDLVSARYGCSASSLVEAPSRAYGRRAYQRAFCDQLRRTARFFRQLPGALLSR